MKRKHVCAPNRRRNDPRPPAHFEPVADVRVTRAARVEPYRHGGVVSHSTRGSRRRARDGQASNVAALHGRRSRAPVMGRPITEVQWTVDSLAVTLGDGDVLRVDDSIITDDGHNPPEPLCFCPECEAART